MTISPQKWAFPNQTCPPGRAGGGLSYRLAQKAGATFLPKRNIMDKLGIGGIVMQNQAL
jgi:hypothetical protein